MKIVDYNLAVELYDVNKSLLTTILDLNMAIAKYDCSTHTSVSFVIFHHGKPLTSGKFDYVQDLVVINNLWYPKNVIHGLDVTYKDIARQYLSCIPDKIQEKIDQISALNVHILELKALENIEL